MEETGKFIRMSLLSMERFLKIFDYFFVTRPILFFPGWATLIAGYLAALSQFNILANGLNPIIHPDFNLVIGVVGFGFAMGGSFILNQLADVETDRNNKKLFFFGEGFISFRSGLIESVLLVLIAFLISLMLPRGAIFILFLFVLITGVMYNFPPFNYKNKPIAGLVMNMLMGWFAFILGWILIRPFGWQSVIQSLPFLFFNTGLYFLTTLPDIKGDQEAGKITFPVKYGFATTVYFSFVFYLLAWLFSITLLNVWLMWVLLFLFPFYLNLIWKRDVTRAILTVKFGISFFCLAICLEVPAFFVLLSLIFFATRFYYKYRFNYEYPTFQGK